METPGDLKFAPTHEWVRVEDDGTLTVGISNHAQEQLGDLVFVETPEIDRSCESSEGIAVVESVKAASDIYAPVNGTVIDANAELADNPELVNTDPHGEGWIFKIQPDEIDEVLGMMDPDDYEAFAAAEG